MFGWIGVYLTQELLVLIVEIAEHALILIYYDSKQMIEHKSIFILKHYDIRNSNNCNVSKTNKKGYFKIRQIMIIGC